jgi:hypothetical protein
MTDRIDAAIAAAKPTEVHKQHTVTISSTGRHMVISRPQDMTEAELFECVGWMANNLRLALEQEAAQRRAGGILTPGGLVPVAKG